MTSSADFFGNFGCGSTGMPRPLSMTARKPFASSGVRRLRQAFHQQLDASLRGRVIRMAGPGNLLMHRAHADDFAGGAGYRGNDAAAQKFSHRAACAQELAGEIDAEHRVPLGQGHVFER